MNASLTMAVLLVISCTLDFVRSRILNNVNVQLLSIANIYNPISHPLQIFFFKFAVKPYAIYENPGYAPTEFRFPYPQ